jgi:hypothetical protein
MATSGVFDTSVKEVEVVFLIFINDIWLIESNKRTKKRRLSTTSLRCDVSLQELTETCVPF